MRKTYVHITLAAMCLLSPGAMADEVAVNGGFETAGGGGSSDSAAWTEGASGGPGSLSERSSMNPNTGSFAQHLVAIGTAGMGANAFISQNSTTDGGQPSLAENTSLSASFSARLAFGPGGVAFYRLRILNGAGAIVAETPLGVLANGTGGVYQTFSMGPLTVPAYGAAPNDVYSAFIELNAAAGAFPESTAEAYIDSVTINGTLVGGAQTGGCCIANVCSIATSAACSGVYQGNGTTCTPDPCAPPASGACCATNGSCTVGTQAACSGAYQGNNTTCTPGLCPASTELATNGGFEIAGFGGATDSFTWVQGASGGEGSLSQRDGTMPRNGGFAHHLIAIGANGMGGNAVISQNSIGDAGFPSLQQNTSLSATFHAKVNLGPGGVGFYRLRILNGAGAIVGQTGLGVITGGTAGAYQSYAMGPLTVPAFGDAPNDVYAAFIEINAAAGAFPESTAEMFIDDVSITGTVVGESTGACCVANVCSVGTQAACTGTYQGNNTTCSPDPCTPPCPADFNDSGSVTVQDIFDFLTAYFNNELAADFNNSGGVTVQDIFDFLSAYFAGCP